MNPSILIGTPCHSHMVHSAFDSSMQRLARSPIAYEHVKVGGGGISWARNKIIAEFFNSSHTHLLFIDSDIEFEPGHVARLVNHNLPMVAAPYYVKSRHARLSGHPVLGYNYAGDEHVVPMAAVGTGFLLLNRETVTKLVDFCETAKNRAYIDPETKKKAWNICWVGVVEDPAHFSHPSYLTEDFGLCYTASLCEITPMLDRGFYVKHYGDISFPLVEPTSNQTSP